MLSVRRIMIGIGAVIAIAILGLFLVTGWYIVDETEQAVLITFGEVEETITEPGLKFKMPWPIQRVVILPRTTETLEVGFRENEAGELEFTNEAKMVTGDENIVLADLIVQWRITNPEQYLFNTDNPKGILYNATSASLRGVIGSSKIDDILTDQRSEIEARVREHLISLIEAYEVGITVMDVKLQDVELPNEEVRKAFTEVTDAREERLTKINEAEKYRNQKINEANGEKDAIISRAEGAKAERIERARGDVAKFNALYEQYLANKEVTRERLVLETLEQILPNAEIYIMDANGNTVNYLPIRPLERTGQQQGQEGGTRNGG